MHTSSSFTRILLTGSRKPRLFVSCRFLICVSLGATSFFGQSQQPRILVNPPELLAEHVTKHNEEIRTTLEIKYADNKIFNPATGQFDPVHLRSYNGSLVGPTIHAQPGDLLHVTLKNSLPANNCVHPQGTHSVPTCFNTTNLHFHGLHVSPTGNSDNVLLELEPGTDMQYEFAIPEDHPAGTFWYHSHRHGSTALQVSSGMAGALIVNGTRRVQDKSKNGIADVDTILRSTDGKPLSDTILLFEQVPYACLDDNGNIIVDNDKHWVCPNNQPGTLEHYGPQFGPGTWPGSGRYTLINGSVQPTINAVTGAISRWRLIHGGVRDTIIVRIMKSDISLPRSPAEFVTAPRVEIQQQPSWTDEHCGGQNPTVIPQWEFAVDGLTLKSIRQKDRNVLQPGYRSDLLLFFPEPAVYCVLDEAAPATAVVNGSEHSQKDRRLLALVAVRDGQSVAGDLGSYLVDQLARANSDLPPQVLSDLRQLKIPEYAPMRDIAPEEVSGHQALVFSIDGEDGLRFGIDHKSFDPSRVDRVLRLNGVDEWTLTSTLANHPFHIHVNPFQVVRILNPQGLSITDGKGQCTEPANDRQYCDQIGVFRDTILVKRNYKVIVRSRYERFIGDFVLHCHILDHEDQGMMQHVRIEPFPNSEAAGLKASKKQ